MTHQQYYKKACWKAFEGYEIPSGIRFGNNANRWNREQIERLVQLCREGMRSYEISKIMNKSPKSIQKAFRRFHFPNLHNVCPRSGSDNSNWRGGIHKGRNGYLYLRRSDHPYANHNGYVLAHRIVIEEHLGRYLLPSEVVHHKDGNPSNNDISNLELFATNGQHLRATLKGVRHNMTPEGKIKLSLSAKNRWAEYRKNNSLPQVGRRKSTHNMESSLDQ